MKPHAHTLYLVLQGEFALYREPRQHQEDLLHIAAPDLDCHSYKAGPWLSDWTDAKYDLPSTPLFLRHASGNRKQACSPHMRHHPCSIPEKNSDLLMKCGPEMTALSNPRIQITAPLPLAILSGLAETTTGVTITVTPPGGEPTPHAVPLSPAVILILVYKWYGERPYISDDSNQSVFESGGPEDFQSIHIYASSPTDENDDLKHAREAFEAAASLLGETATICWDPNPRFVRIAATPPAGLSWAQVNLYFNEVLKLKGSPLLEEDFVDIRTTKLPFEWENPTKLGETTNCGPVTGDDDNNP